MDVLYPWDWHDEPWQQQREPPTGTIRVRAPSTGTDP